MNQRLISFSTHIAPSSSSICILRIAEAKENPNDINDKVMMIL